MAAPLGRLLLRRFAISALHRPPIVVEQTANAGRGVFATRDIVQGEFIHSAEPLVAHPKLECISKVCYNCLKAIGQQYRPPTVRDSEELRGSIVLPKRAPADEGYDGSLFSPTSGVGSYGDVVLFCSAPCEVNAKNFLLIESRGDWAELHQYCRENCLKFPLVARRLACMVASGAASPDALDILSYPFLPDGIPPQWNEERALLLRTLKGAGVHPRTLEFLSKEWYAGIIARLHMNAFAIEMIDTGRHMDLLEAATSSVSGEGSVGTAVYILPSMYNHDCDPNVNVRWPGNATVKLEARQTIKAGEELRITYVDASMAYDARQEILSKAYGFSCQCPRCRDKD